jgi:hypothetical protein
LRADVRSDLFVTSFLVEVQTKGSNGLINHEEGKLEQTGESVISRSTGP